MAESLALPDTTDREAIYTALLPQIASLVSGETDLTANLANIAAVLKEAFDFFWVGFYLKKGDQLVLGPFQGPLACTRIDFDKGVCGHAFSTGRTTVVADVDEFPGHIACSTQARSEIVVPMIDARGEVFGVLDVDSDRAGDFTKADAAGLGNIIKVVEQSMLQARPEVL